MFRAFRRRSGEGSPTNFMAFQERADVVDCPPNAFESYLGFGSWMILGCVGLRLAGSPKHAAERVLQQVHVSCSVLPLQQQLR